MTSQSSNSRRLNRRRFLQGSAAIAGLGVLGTGVWQALQDAPRSGRLLSAFENARGNQFAGGIDLETGKVFGTEIAARAHGCAVDPNDSQRVIFFARRPGTLAFELRCDTLHARTIFDTGDGRHLAGHGVFTHDGEWLITPEYDYEKQRGMIAVRDTRHFRIEREFDSHGLDPHEIAWLPGTGHLLVANGGIMTHPRSFRRKLNLDTMDPSLVVMNPGTAEMIEQWRLPDHQLSIRHLSVGANASVVGLQYEGERVTAPGGVAIYRPGSTARNKLQLLATPADRREALQGYVASVALSEQRGLITAACPFGAGIACWSLDDERFLGVLPATEAYGLARLQDGSVVASQRDGHAWAIDVRQRLDSLIVASDAPIRWDDHWLATV